MTDQKPSAHDSVQILTRGRVLDAEYQCIVDDHQYFIRLEATPRAVALIRALGIQTRYVGPAEDGGRAWHQFAYTDALDDALKELIDFTGDTVYSQPKFGQMILFDQKKARNG